MMPESLSHVYTSYEEIKNCYTAMGVDLRIDDERSGYPDQDTLQPFIEEATDEINTYCLDLYSAADLANSLWVRRRCSWLAANLLSVRGNDPEAFTSRVAQIRSDLEKVRTLVLRIPRLSYSADMAPAMSNLRVDDRYSTDKIRVQPSTSVDIRNTNQHLDPRHRYEIFD